ncbi:hypothetical protein [Pseudomonas nicosulfuronedens]
MNREDVAMDLTFENLDLLRKEVHAAKLLLSECDKVLEEDGGVYIELRAFLSGKMDADDVIALLASQQGEQVKHPEQADGAQGDACAWLESLEGDAWADACEEIAASVKKMRQQADDEKVEREAFEAHESKERRLSPTDQQFWFRRGAIADYDLKSIDDAWKAWKARAALAQPALQCKKCGGTGDADSGGIHPWGEAAMVPCDCAHTERAQGERKRFEAEVLGLGLPVERDHHGAYVSDHVRHLWSGWELRAALAQPSPAEDMSAAQELAGVKAILNDMADALKRLTFHARTTGGTAGPDAALMNACERAERILSLGGMGAAFMRGCDEHESQPSPAPELELERGTVYVEARRCSGCGHAGVNDGADGLSACGHCEWTGPQPSKDECPDCLRQNCMSVACPECGGRYELVAEANVAAPVSQAGQVPDRLELTEDLKNILGRPNFTCTHFAEALRRMGHSIDRKSEAEQAACLHWMLNHYLAHGADWKAHAEAELKAAAAAQGGSTDE